MYSPSLWVPKSKTVEVYLVQLDNLNDIRDRLGASDIRQAYNRGGTILIEWTMMHRETFSALVGQYIVRNERGEFEVLDQDALQQDYEPFVVQSEVADVNLVHPELGRLVAFHRTDDVINEVVFELPDGSPAQFVLPSSDEKEAEPAEEPKNPTPSPADLQRGKNQQKENNS